MSIHKLFTEHPASVGETYFQHLAHASRFATRMMAGGAACMVHAVLPFMFVKTGSRVIEDLNGRMVLNRGKAAPSRAPFANVTGIR